MDEGRQGLVGTPPFGLGANGLNPHLNQGNGFMLEFMGTLVLCMTVVMTAVHKSRSLKVSRTWRRWPLVLPSFWPTLSWCP